MHDIGKIQLFDKVAKAAVTHQFEDTESPIPYQPYRRLVRVADIMDESSDIGEPSGLGGTYSDDSTSATPQKTNAKPKPAKTQTLLHTYFTPVPKRAKQSTSPPWAEACPLPEGVLCTPEDELPTETQIPTMGREEAWTPMNTVTPVHSSTTGENADESLRLMQQTQALFDSPSKELNESELLRQQTRELFNSPIWGNEQWEQYTRLERARVKALDQEYNRDYIRYQALAKRATGYVPPYVWRHDRDIDRTGRIIVEDWVNEQLRNLRAEANARLHRERQEQSEPTTQRSQNGGRRYTPLFEGEPDIVIPVIMTGEAAIQASRAAASGEGRAANTPIPTETDEFPLEEGFAEAFERSLRMQEDALAERPQEEHEEADLVVHGLLAAVMTDSPNLRSQEIAGSKLRHTVKTAAGYGSYVTVRIGNVVMIWHVDSGASLTQVSPDQIQYFDPPLERVDAGSVNFKSAEHASATDVIMYKTTSLVLIQMESGLTTVSVTTYVLSNPRLRPKTRLLGLNTLKDLGLSESFGNDTLVDPLGRPFRKIPQTQLRMLRQQVNVWNRKHARSNQANRYRDTEKIDEQDVSAVETQASVVKPLTGSINRSQKSGQEGADPWERRHNSSKKNTCFNMAHSTPESLIRQRDRTMSNTSGNAYCPRHTRRTYG